MWIWHSVVRKMCDVLIVLNAACHTVAERMRILLCVILWYNIVDDETFSNTKTKLKLSADVPLLIKKIII